MSPIQEDTLFNKPNTCLKITPDRELVVDRAPIPQILPHQVMVHIKATGVCGSDIHLWKDGGIGNLKITEDLIIGHETAGEIVGIGSDVVQGFEIGDRVAIEPQTPCGKCFLCTGGHLNLCNDVDFLGMPGMPGRAASIPGSMQRFLVLDPMWVHKIPDNMSFEEGALVEVFSVAYHGIERAGNLELGKPCFIAGMGPIGLATLVLADAAGAYPIVVSDVSQDRLDFAKELIPSIKTYQIQTDKDVKENANNIRSIFGNDEYEMPSAVLECTGVHSSINTCCYVVRRKGALTILGVSGKNEIDNFPFMTISFGEVDVKFVNRYRDSWPPVINLIASGKVDVKKFVTHKFSLEQANKALETVRNPKIPSIKVMVCDDVELF